MKVHSISLFTYHLLDLIRKLSPKYQESIIRVIKCVICYYGDFPKFLTLGSTAYMKERRRAHSPTKLSM